MREAEATLLAKKRAKVADGMLESAADFFAMKTTGAGIIAPIFLRHEDYGGPGGLRGGVSMR